MGATVFKEKNLIDGYIGKNKRKDKVFRKKHFEPLEVIKHYTLSDPLTDQEKEIINSMSGTFWNPRNKYSHFSFSYEPEPWQVMGFVSRYHYAGWLHFSQLTNEQFTGFDVDLLHKKTSGEMSDNY